MVGLIFATLDLMNISKHMADRGFSMQQRLPAWIKPNSSCISSLDPHEKRTTQRLDYELIGSTVIESPVACATCKRLCDSDVDWENLPIFPAMDLVRDEAIKETTSEYEYLKFVRRNQAWDAKVRHEDDQRQSECNYVCEIPHAFVDEIGHVCAVNDGICFVQHDCGRVAPYLPSDVSSLHRHAKVLVITQNWGKAIFHGILENMIKLGDVLDVLHDHKDIYVHVPGDTSAGILFRPILSDLGIEPSRIVHGPIIADLLIYPRATGAVTQQSDNF